jgi:hypothetical protein
MSKPFGIPFGKAKLQRLRFGRMRKPIGWMLLAMIGACLIVWGTWHKLRSPSLALPTPSLAARSDPAQHRSATRGLEPNQLRAKLKSARDVMSASSTNRASQMAELRTSLASMAPNECSEAIRRFLDSGENAQTGQGFKVRSDGFLEEAPSLRVWLLDYLSKIDPASAAMYAKRILDNKGSADEWAIALRCVALSDGSEGRFLLEAKTAELLTNQAWQQNPSTGYLEAFDVAVHLGGTNLIPALGELVRNKENNAVAHAAYLTLDRLTISDPVTTLSMLASDPELMRGREETRANYFARADVRDAGQRALLESYLLRFDPGAVELDRFAGLYPNANYMVSPNLLTKSATPDSRWLKARDTEALKVNEEWLADTRFQRLRPQLERIRGRLTRFVQQP